MTRVGEGSAAGLIVNRLVATVTVLLTLVASGCGGLDGETEQELEALATAAVEADVKLQVTGSLGRALAGNPLASRLRPGLERRVGLPSDYRDGDVEIRDVSVERDGDTARADITALVSLTGERSDEPGLSEETYVVEIEHRKHWLVASVRNPSEFDPDG